MLSTLAAPAAASSSLTYRELKTILQGIVSGPQYLEYRDVDPPTVTYTRAVCDAAKNECVELTQKVMLLQADIDEVALAIGKATKVDEKMTKLLLSKQIELRTAKDDLNQQNTVFSGFSKNRTTEMAEFDRYATLCKLVLPALGNLKEILLQSSILGSEENQVSIKTLFMRLNNFIDNSAPANSVTLMQDLVSLINRHAIPALYNDVGDRFQLFFSGFNALRLTYANEPTLLTLLSPTVFVGAILQSLPRGESSPGFMDKIRGIPAPVCDAQNFIESSSALNAWFSSLLNVCTDYGRLFVLAPSASKAVLATVAKGPPRLASGISLRGMTPEGILAMTHTYSKDVPGPTCVCPVHGPDIGKHPLWLCNTFLNRLDELPLAGKNADFMALVAKNKASIDARRLKYAATSRDAPPK